MEKSWFGGYKKSSADFLVKQLTEDEEHAQEKIALLESELRASKENKESLQQELEQKQKSIFDLTFMIDEKEQKLKECEQKHENAASTDAYNDDAWIKKIGQFYVNAQEYAEKLQNESKEKTLDLIDYIFDELYKTQKQLETDLLQFGKNKCNLKQQLSQILETQRSLQDQVEKIGYDQVNVASFFEDLKALKDHVKNQVEYEYAGEKEEAYLPDASVPSTLPENDKTEKEPDVDWKGTSEPAPEPAPEPRRDDYWEQLQEYRRKSQDRRPVPMTQEQETDTAPTVSAPGQPPEQVPEKPEHTPEKELSVGGDYSEYFSDITKEYAKSQHSLRVATLCKKMGTALGLPQDQMEDLKAVGLLHDIGKIAIDKEILTKKGRLTDSEWKEIMRHPEVGYRILSMVNGMSRVAEYVLAHHESWDGTGYPRGLKEKEIPLAARILKIADAYDAMTSERSYKRTLSEQDAIEELQKNAGTQFDPELVDIFVEKVLKH